MKIKRIVGGILESNGYIIYQNTGGECYIIDPGYNGERFLKAASEEQLKIKGILLTHHHHDHVGAVGKIRQRVDCPVYMHREDLDMYRDPVDNPLEDGDVIMLDGEEIRVIHTPGHTWGGVCFYSEKSKVAFTGDTIFNVDLGRTDLEDGSESDMEASCRNIINKWSNEIWIYPGHGDGCSMKKVRQINKEFLQIIGELE